MRTDFELAFERFVQQLDQEKIQILTQKVRDYCALHGVMFKDQHDNVLVHHVPLTLFPSPFPVHLYVACHSLQETVNKIIYRISNDVEFLTKTHQEMCCQDDFIKNLVEIMKSYHEYKFKQATKLLIIRSDYMTHDERYHSNSQPILCLVEYNTVSASFGAHATDIPKIHERVMNDAYALTKSFGESQLLDKQRPIAEDLGAALGAGWADYVKKNLAFESCILFIVQNGERNRFDQIKVEQHFLKHVETHCENIFKQNIKHPYVFYLSLDKVTDHCFVNDTNTGALWYHPNKLSREICYEVAIVYFRAGYSPKDFSTQQDWEARKLLELNRAIKVPTIAEQLTGSKKVQQIMATPNFLEKYTSKKNAAKLRSTYNGIYSLDDGTEGLKDLLNQVTANPQNYVLKPQREGGGNNIYGPEITVTINRLLSSGKSLSEFIIMDIIKPTIYKNYLVLPDHQSALLCDCVSEVGIFGMYLHDGKSDHLNVASGYLLRTKSIDHLDGGVASGRAVLDSILRF